MEKKFLATGAALVATSLAPQESWAQTAEPKIEKQSAAQKEPAQLEKIFEGIKATDQNGKAIDIPALAKNGQCIVLFGYGFCPVCAEITKTVAAIQKKMLAAGIKDVPIVVVSAQPEKDKDNMPVYVSGYYVSGVKQFADENIEIKDKTREELGKELLGAAEKLPQNNRILHVVTPASAEDTQTMQKRLAEIAKTSSGIDPKNPKQHTRFITLVSDGKVVASADGKGPVIGAKLDTESNQFEASETLVEEQSARMLADLQKIREQKKAVAK